MIVILEVIRIIKLVLADKNVLGVPVVWRSKAQKSVSLSSSEAEYVAVSEVCTEILFIKTITDFLGLEVELPITIFCDNIGAIYIAHNPKKNNINIFTSLLE